MGVVDAKQVKPEKRIGSIVAPAAAATQKSGGRRPMPHASVWYVELCTVKAGTETTSSCGDCPRSLSRPERNMAYRHKVGSPMAGKAGNSLTGASTLGWGSQWLWSCSPISVISGVCAQTTMGSLHSTHSSQRRSASMAQSNLQCRQRPGLASEAFDTAFVTSWGSDVPAPSHTWIRLLLVSCA
ncbi:unnamed protein product [Mycena citricolor]|uniref:Uncharacterized protein n=1 Tax=Mycena citricolor TaxID=2018698 RepID=A0AAD2GZZ6_9AGAR|nr:unnamed protein product [Mycena citricolor]